MIAPVERWSLIQLDRVGQRICLPAQQRAVDTATTNRRKVGRDSPVHERAI